MPSLNIIGNINLTGGEYKRNPFIATGGIINTFTSGGINYTSHTFISGSGSFTILNGESTAQVLVVGAGGAGSRGGLECQGGDGGGAGGLAYTSSFFFRKNYSGGPSNFIATVAEANNGLPTGSSSTFISTYGYEQIAPVIAYGGGSAGYNGASGGGSGGLAIYGPLGNNGGTGGTAGGGGAGAVGFDGCSGPGGAGLGFTMQDGTLKYYAGGGGGGGYSSVGPRPGGAGGIGGGGSGGGGVQGVGQPGEANTGGGGGGGNTASDTRDSGNGGPGGSGIIIICYPTNGI